MIKKLALSFKAVLGVICAVALFMFPQSAFAYDYTIVTLVPGETESWSPYNDFYLSPGKFIYLDVNNDASRMFYVKIVPQNNPNGTPVYQNYFSGGTHVADIKIGAPVGYYLVQMKCTTGRTVFTDCDGSVFIEDSPY